MGNAKYSEFPNGISSQGVPTIGNLNPISGKMYHVNPNVGSDGNRGTSARKPFDTLTKALDVASTTAGDGIIVYAPDGGTTADCTTYLTAAETISHDSLSIFGVTPGSRIYGRSRVANASTSLDLASMITISGSNNLLANLHVANYGSDATALGGVIVSGNRNRFVGCHFIGAGHATPRDETGANSLTVTGEENEFESCIIGTDTVAASTTNAEIVFASQATRNIFRNCLIITFADNAGHLFISANTASCLDRFALFENCTFINPTASTATGMTEAISMHASAGGYIILKNCTIVGATEWEKDDTGNVMIDGAAPTAATSGIAVEPAT